jgi:HAD superfamily hydrolase (TIGR01549 family)
VSTSLDAALQARPDAVLIDLDNTLYPYLPAHAAGMTAVWRNCEARLGLNAPTFDKNFEIARQDVKQRLGHTASAHSRLLYFQRLIELTTGKSDPGMALDLEKIYWRRYMFNARLCTGARDLIDELRYARIPLALVTDLTAQIQMRKLVYFELDHTFDTIVTSEEAGADKPDPRIFTLALEKLALGTTRPRVWMIGDDGEKDIRGARSAVDATTIQKLHDGVQRTPDADVHLTDFSLLAAAIRRLFPAS